MKLAAGRGIPPMRPLFFDFDNDPNVARVEDEFLFGPDILVALSKSGLTTNLGWQIGDETEYATLWAPQAHAASAPNSRSG